MTPRLLGLVALVIAPVVVLSASPWAAGGSLFFLGMLPAGVGVLISVRVALVSGLVTAALMMGAVPFREQPVAGSLLMAAIGVAVGLSSTRGWHGVGSLAGPQTAFALIGAPMVALASSTVSADSSPAATVAMGAWVAAGGLWITLLGRLAGDALPSREPPAVPAAAGRYFAVALGLLAGIGAWIAMQWTTAPGAWWLLLTLFVVIQPSYAATMQRAAHRVLGTVVGAVLAAVVAGV
ncbi:FUSC family protein, partial [Ornithinimicrobium sp.]|uniref:FUSC family protein n=1 Tax=Ornithinimicrobium sp. TaxID=1977084 RepID=UPI002B45CA3C